MLDTCRAIESAWSSSKPSRLTESKHYRVVPILLTPPIDKILRLDGNVGLNVISILVITDMMCCSNVMYRSNIQ